MLYKSITYFLIKMTVQNKMGSKHIAVILNVFKSWSLLSVKRELICCVRL